jgi:hypothetical protein
MHVAVWSWRAAARLAAFEASCVSLRDIVSTSISKSSANRQTFIIPTSREIAEAGDAAKLSPRWVRTAL